MIGGRTALYGVVGHPVAHSRSPQMQNAAFARLGIDAAYLALPVEPEALPVALSGALVLGFQGLNVTVPHKVQARWLCARVDPVASEIGAVNTLRRAPEGWEGSNTDAPALRSLLAEAGLRRGARVLLLGAGGAARAAAWALAELSAEVQVMARRPDAAAALADELLVRPGARRPRTAPLSELAAEAGGAEAIVNATAVGLHGGASAFPGLRFEKGQLAVDFVYGETAFAAAAAAAGARLVSGEAILVRQGALAFTQWTGRAAPEAEMAAALRAAAESSP